MNPQVITTADGVGVRMFDLRTSGTDNLLMLHGVGRAGRTFSSFAMMLPERFRIRTLDFRGHGASGRAFEAYRIVDYVRDATAAIDAIGKPVVLYGHSLGSLVSAAAASLRPQLVRAVVLEDPPSSAFWAGLKETQYYPTFKAMRRWAGRSDLSIPEITASFGNEVVKSWPDGRVMRIRDVRDAVSLRFSATCARDMDPAVMDCILHDQWQIGYDYHAVFSAIRCPALLMRGDTAKGGMLPEEDAVTLSQLMSDSVRIDFPTAGHLLHWQVRSELAGQVSAFLETL
jgi:pimeloyl-ACP methyl ester carboxylesterase